MSAPTFLIPILRHHGWMRDMSYASRKVADREVMPIGFGAMRLGLEGRPSAPEAVQTLHAAFDAGVQLIDTAVNYCLGPDEFGYDEALVARAIHEWSGDRDQISVICKGGVLRTATEQVLLNGSAQNLRWSCETSLRSLGVDQIWLYLLHGVDPNVPFEESIAALAELQREGKVQHLGLSNVGRKQLIAAQELMTIASVQNGLSLWNRASLPLAHLCAELDIAFHAYGPLGSRTQDLMNPTLTSIAARHDRSAAQVALAWVLAQTNTTIPIPGGRRPESVRDSAAAADLKLTEQDLAELDGMKF